MEANQEVMERKQYIVVKIDNEQYGIDISFVDNIVRMQRITRVPKAQDYFEGVINLRGEVIPVMSMRKKFGLEPDQITNKTRIIIIKTEQALVGVQVDEVKEVVTLEDADVEKTAYDAASARDEKIYLAGIGKHDDELISLLNIQTVVVDKEALVG